MTPRETVIEAMAAAAWERFRDGQQCPWDWPTWSGLLAEGHQGANRVAQFRQEAAWNLVAALSTLPALGLVVVPVEATEKMLNAMRLVFPDPCEEWDDVRLFGEEWAAALAASPNVLGDAP